MDASEDGNDRENDAPQHGTGSLPKNKWLGNLVVGETLLEIGDADVGLRFRDVP